MIYYTFKRVLWLIPVIIAVSFIVFMLVELAPGDIVDGMTTGDMTEEQITALREKYNLHRSVFYRYGLYMLNLVQGDLGQSEKSGYSVFEAYMTALPNTLILSLSSAVIGIAISIPMGIRAARKAGKIMDTATTTFTLVGMSMPAFWLGLMLLLLFSLQLKWLPAAGNREGVRSLILPAVCCAMVLTATCTRQTRSSMLEVLKADFLRTARAKGAPEKIVIRKHALGNALIPVITVIGSTICIQLAGSAVIEQVFAWPGVGRMLVEGVITRDVTVITGCVVMTTILYVLVMLVVDLLYALVDPRIKSQYMRKKRKRNGSAPAPDEHNELDAESAMATAELGHNEDIATELCMEAADYSDTMLPQTDSSDWKEDRTGSEQADIPISDVISFETEHNEDKVIEETPESAAKIIKRYKKRGQLAEIWHRLIHNKSSLAGIIILGFVLMIAIISLFISFESVTASNVPVRFTPPSRGYPFGTDSMGRNAFLRVIYGSRYSLIIGFSAVAISSFIGITLGSTAAYYGGWTDNIIMRICDTLSSIPGLLLGMVIMVVLGLKLENLIIAVAVGGIPPFLRISRASILTVRGNEYIEAARAVGYSDLRIIVTQVLPNGLSPIIVQASVSLGLQIMVAASLSFLGFGVPAPTPEWGALISAGREFARSAPWLMAFPGVAIMITVLGFNLLGDGLRDALDPKMKK